MSNSKNLWLISVIVLFVFKLVFSSEKFSGYNEECITHKCNFNKNLYCREGAQRCVCKDSEMEYDTGFEGCLYPSTEHNSWHCMTDSQCNKTWGKYAKCIDKKCGCKTVTDDINNPERIINFDNSCLIMKIIGDECFEHFQCDKVDGERAYCEYDFDEKISICQCKNGSYYDPRINQCIKVYKSANFYCESNNQCNHPEGLGKLSYCNAANKCVCYDTSNQDAPVKLGKDNKCYYAKGANQTCNNDEECHLGFHNNSICAFNPKNPSSYEVEKICSCPENQICNSSKIFVHNLNKYLLALVFFTKLGLKTL